MNQENELTLEEAVKEVLATLTGQELTYDPELDRFRAVTRALNRALRAVSLENEWSWYYTTASVGQTQACEQVVAMSSSIRPRQVDDDAVRLVGDEGQIIQWAYFLPRDAIHKYRHRNGLWVASSRNLLEFSRPFTEGELGLDIQVPVMREPMKFRLPGNTVTVPKAVLKQLVDFPYPDLVVAKAAYFYAQTDPVLQPRAQTLEAEYKNLMYQLVERDTARTDTPYTNEFILPLENGLVPDYESHRHPHSNFT